jgi:hypothetical protein
VGRIAYQQADEAVQARETWKALKRDSAQRSPTVDRELDAGPIAVCAAAFSVEALLLILEENRTQQGSTGWQSGRRQKGFTTRLRRELQSAVMLDDRQIEILAVDFQPVITKRGNAVHNLSVMEPPVPHPALGNTARATVDFSMEGAIDAVAGMRNIYKALVEAPKPLAEQWVNLQHRALSYLAGLSPNL